MAADSLAPDQEGRLSNPLQRHLSEATIDEIVTGCLTGSSINRLAAQLGVDRTTIISHVDRRSIARRRIARKLTDGHSASTHPADHLTARPQRHHP